MTTNRISITRALSQLKTLDKRIDAALRSCQPAAVVIGNNLPNGYASESELKAKLQSNLDKPTGLIQHRNTIKRAIVMSNATTRVKVGNQEMSVAEAIEQKATINAKKDLLDSLRDYMANANRQYQAQMDRANERADKTVEGVMGASAEKKGDEYKQFVEAFMATNGPKFIKADNIDKVIEDLDAEVTAFEHEVDYVLSESNATTFIEVSSEAL